MSEGGGAKIMNCVANQLNESIHTKWGHTFLWCQLEEMIGLETNKFQGAFIGLGFKP